VACIEEAHDRWCRPGSESLGPSTDPSDDAHPGEYGTGIDFAISRAERQAIE
jgi:hypothetical protein